MSGNKANLDRMVFAGILLLGAALRFAALGGIPNGVYVDEASLGYNAWAVATTGADENGVRFPLYPLSLGGGKNPVYFYAAAASTAVLGLTPFAVRLPAALFGVLTVFAVRRLAASLFRDRLTPLFAAALIAVSPWHVHFSRVAFEAALFPLFATLGLGGLWLGLNGKGFLWKGPAWLGLSAYCYAVGAVWAPVVFLLGSTLFFKEMVRRRKEWLLAAAVLAVLLAPLTFKGGQTGAQRDYFRRISVFRDPARPEGRPDVPGGLVRAAKNYALHFSPSFLFLKGDRSTPRHHPPHGGQLPLAYAPALVMAIALCLGKGRREGKLLLIALAVAPLPDSLTTDSVPHAIRSITFVPCVELLAAMALGAAGSWLISVTGRRAALKSRPAAAAFLGLFFSALALQGAGFYRYYFQRHPFEPKSVYDWKAGFSGAVEYIEKRKDAFDGVVVSSGIPYVYSLILFHSRMDPAIFRASGFEKPALGRSPQGAFDRYRIADIGALSGEGRFLLLRRPGETASWRGKNVRQRKVYEALSNGGKGFPVLEVLEVVSE